jgi:hypothetical protein
MRPRWPSRLSCHEPHPRARSSSNCDDSAKTIGRFRSECLSLLDIYPRTTGAVLTCRSACTRTTDAELRATPDRAAAAPIVIGCSRYLPISLRAPSPRTGVALPRRPRHRSTGSNFPQGRHATEQHHRLSSYRTVASNCGRRRPACRAATPPSCGAVGTLPRTEVERPAGGACHQSRVGGTRSYGPHRVSLSRAMRRLRAEPHRVHMTLRRQSGLLHDRVTRWVTRPDWPVWS